MTQLNMLNIALSSAALTWSLALDRDLDQLSARTGPDIHAAGSDKFGLVVRVAAEDAENRRHVCVVHHLLVASEKTRDVAARQTGFAHDVRLFERVPFRDAPQGRAEVAHTFFCRARPILWEFRSHATYSKTDRRLTWFSE